MVCNGVDSIWEDVLERGHVRLWLVLLQGHSQASTASADAAPALS